MRRRLPTVHRSEVFQVRIETELRLRLSPAFRPACHDFDIDDWAQRGRILASLLTAAGASALTQSQWDVLNAVALKVLGLSAEIVGRLSIKNLAMHTGYTERTVKDSITRLVELGLLDTENMVPGEDMKVCRVAAVHMVPDIEKLGITRYVPVRAPFSSRRRKWISTKTPPVPPNGLKTECKVPQAVDKSCPRSLGGVSSPIPASGCDPALAPRPGTATTTEARSTEGPPALTFLGAVASFFRWISPDGAGSLALSGDLKVSPTPKSLEVTRGKKSIDGDRAAGQAAQPGYDAEPGPPPGGAGVRVR